MFVCIAGGYAINAIEARRVMEGATSLLMCDLMMSRWMDLMGCMTAIITNLTETIAAVI